MPPPAPGATAPLAPAAMPKPASAAVPVAQAKIVHRHSGPGLAQERDRLPQVAERIFRLTLAVASGERSKSELLGLGDHEFVPWHLGIVS